IIEDYKGLPERAVLEGNGLLNSPDGEFGSIVSTFKTNLSVFFDPRVSANLSGSDFSLMDLRKERTTIYITVKNSDQTRLKSIMSLFFETCTLAMLDHEPTKDEYPVTAFLDEFVRMARMKELLEMPAIGRSYKFNAIYVCQSFSQIVDIYGQAGADQLKNTCSYHVFFAQNEQKVAEDISKSIGDLTRDKLTYSGSGKGLTRNKS
ncbi:MAG: type IV secretory system conjugative DNA transfer family protein, partial [Desulfobacteraceae bacterium]|nr:type IV secretory system conjugative DNA transfer family protein [Desulfobacteraceae bacterium]